MVLKCDYFLMSDVKHGTEVEVCDYFISCETWGRYVTTSLFHVKHGTEM